MQQFSGQQILEPVVVVEGCLDLTLFSQLLTIVMNTVEICLP